MPSAMVRVTLEQRDEGGPEGTRRVVGALIVGTPDDDPSTFVSSGYMEAGRAAEAWVRGATELFNRRSTIAVDWVEAFAPVVFAPHAPKQWPETIVVDHVPFHVRSGGNQAGRLRFSVFAAYGGDPGKQTLGVLAASQIRRGIAAERLLNPMTKGVNCGRPHIPASRDFLELLEVPWGEAPCGFREDVAQDQQGRLGFIGVN